MIHAFRPSDTDFTSNGERPISLLKAIEKKDKDTWEVEVSASLKYLDIFKQDFVLHIPTKYGYQPFRIDNPETLNNSIRSIAKHIAYDLKNHLVTLATPIEMNCADAMGEVLSHSYPLCSFNVYSDITTEKTFSIINMSMWDAMIQLSKEYNGHLDFDGFQIRITAEQGADRGVNIEYGSTLQGAKVKENWDLVVTELYPVTTSGLTIGWLYSDVVYDRPYARRVEFDVETEDQLTFQANLYLNRYKVPRINYEVTSSMIQNVFLGDTIQVVARQFSIFTEVISYEFNVLTQKIIKLEFGNFRNTLRSFFGELRGDIEETTLKKAQIKVDEVKGQILLKADREELKQIQLTPGPAGPPGEDAYRLDIFSSNGTIFKNGQINTILIVRAYKGAEDVTDQFDASRFRWTRTSHDSISDQIWNTSHFGGVKQVTITNDDLFARATFNCELMQQ